MALPYDTHPFTDPAADVIFCSSDHVHFRLHKNILSIASDFFKDMFSLAQPSLLPSCAPHNSADTDGLQGVPVVHVTESSVVLERLFRLCYPIKDPLLQTIEQVRPTLEAALKYQMEEAIEIATQSLLDLVKTAPLRVYAIAHLLSLDIDIVCTAARTVLEQKVQDTYVEELDELPAYPYRQLLLFCEEGNKADSHQIIRGVSMRSSARKCEGKSSPCPAEFGPNSESGDVVIQTSDNVSLHISRSTLTLCSPVFKERLSAMAPSSVSEPALLALPEPSRVVLQLLEICHPAVWPKAPTDLDDIDAALDAAETYHITKAVSFLHTALHAFLRTGATEPTVDPVALYYFACRRGLPELASSAARRTWAMKKIRLVDLFPGDAHFTEGISAGALWRLLDYHRQCRAAIQAVMEGDEWMSEAWKKKLNGFCRGGQPCWVDGYWSALKEQPWLDSASATSEAVIQAATAWAYKECRNSCDTWKGLPMLFEFSKYVGRTIEALEREVTLEWPKHANTSPAQTK